MTRTRFHRAAVSALALLTTICGVGATTADASTGYFGAGSPRMGTYVTFRSLYGNQKQCLDAMDEDGGRNGNRVQVWTCNGSSNQRWFWTGRSGTEQEGALKSVRFPGMCLDADLNGEGRNGTILQLWRCNYEEQQMWTRDYSSAHSLWNDRFYFNGNVVVDRDINGPTDGAKVQLWQRNYQPQQSWAVE